MYFVPNVSAVIDGNNAKLPPKLNPIKTAPRYSRAGVPAIFVKAMTKMPCVAHMMMTDILRPSLSDRLPQAILPKPLASEKNTAIAVPATALAAAMAGLAR